MGRQGGWWKFRVIGPSQNVFVHDPGMKRNVVILLYKDFFPWETHLGILKDLTGRTALIPGMFSTAATSCVR